MSEKSPSETELRKRHHLEAALGGDAYTRDAGFERIELPYDALFEVSESSLDSQARIGGETLRFPLMIGAMTANSVSFTTILAIPLENGDPVMIQDSLDTIFKGLIPLLYTLGCLKMLRKNISVNWIIIGTMAVGLALGLLGIC